MSTDDEAAYLAEIEAEFAALESEIARIAALPQAESPAKVMMLKALREQWQKKATAKSDQPEWRRKIDAAIGPALEKILEEGLQDAGGGQLGFNLNPESLKAHGGPVLDAVLEGFQGMMAEKMKAQQKAAAEAKAKGEPAPAPNPFGPALQALLMQLMAGVSKMKMAAADEATTAAPTDPGAAPKDHAETTGEATLKVEQDLSTSIKGTFKPTTDAAAFNAAGKQLLQTLFGGLGQMLNSVAAQKKAAPPARAAADDGAPGAAPGAAPEASDDDRAPKAPEPPKEATEPQEAPEQTAKTAEARQTRPVKVNIDFAGLFGSLLKARPAKPAAPEADAETKADPAPEPPTETSE